MRAKQNLKSQQKNKLFDKTISKGKNKKQASTKGFLKSGDGKSLMIDAIEVMSPDSLGSEVPLIDTSEGDVTIIPELVGSKDDGAQTEKDGMATLLNPNRYKPLEKAMATEHATDQVFNRHETGKIKAENGVSINKKSSHGAKPTLSSPTKSRVRAKNSTPKKGKMAGKITITSDTGKGKLTPDNEVSSPTRHKRSDKIVITSSPTKEKAGQKTSAASSPSKSKTPDKAGENSNLAVTNKTKDSKKISVLKRDTKKTPRVSKKAAEGDNCKKQESQNSNKNSEADDKTPDSPEKKTTEKVNTPQGKKPGGTDNTAKDQDGESTDDGMEIDIDDLDSDDGSSDSKDSRNETIKDPNEEHIIVLKEAEGGASDKYETFNKSKRPRFKCGICGKFSSAKADLLKHIRIHTGERPFKCKVCSSTFVQITALRGHETIHTGEKPFRCDICNKSFALKDRLRLHMRVHTGEKPHKCDQCDQTFARRSQVTQHSRVHTGEKAYECAECGARFASYHTLRGHLNAHRGVKEFQCGACGKKFIRVEGLYKHIRTVHRGSRPYYCNLCGKAFKGHLQQHMRLHLGVRPFECSTCGATFTQNSQLTVHMRIHTGERPYKCQICGAAFAHSSACKIHMRSHTGEKPFQCVLCSTSFSQLPHLKKHMKCVHNAAKPYLCTICKEFFQTQNELDGHERTVHGMDKTAEQEAEEMVEESALARLRNRLAVLLYRISSEERRRKFGFGQRLVDEVLKLSLESSGHVPINDKSLSRLDELRKNVLLLLKWTIPKDTMEEYHKNNMTVDEVLDMLTS
ncbi:zinc finger protein 37 [Procambarus clarkii]|uniref:zinc finger protein 37 n=1 Tax=Procambarus clarkii TaxID=6728 RepID=UPI0037449D56